MFRFTERFILFYYIYNIFLKRARERWGEVRGRRRAARRGGEEAIIVYILIDR